MYLMMSNTLMKMVSALTAMAFYTLSERKFLGYMQHRKGSNKPSMTNSSRSKINIKTSKPMAMNTNTKFYLLSPMIMIILALLLWPIFPHNSSLFL